VCFKLLADPDARVRVAAAAVLGGMGTGREEIVDALTQALADADPAVREAAALALGGVGPAAAPAAPALADLARRDPNRRPAAALALAWTGRSTTDTLQVLSGTLTTAAFWRGDGNSEPADPNDAVEVLGDARRLLKSIEPDNAPDPRREVLLALSWLGEGARPCAPALVGIVKRKANPPELRLLAASALVTLEPDSRPPRFPDLVGSVRDRYARGRVQAVSAIGWLGAQGEPAQAELLMMLKDRQNSPALRIAAAAALGRIAQQSADAPAALGEILRSEPEGGVKAAAAGALGLLGGAAKSAVVPLMDALKSPDVQVRQAAALALGQIAQEAASAVPALAQALKDKELPVRLAAAAALARFGRDAREAAAALVQLKSDPNPLMRQYVAEALEKIQG
jgi:HEAT repeat protein